MRTPGVIILAAGGSTRMGRPKQLLPWGESTFLRHAAETALGTGWRPVIVVLGCAADSCRAMLAGLPVAAVVNERWDRGLGGSLATGIGALERADTAVSGALVMLADQPAVSPPLLAALLKAWLPPRRPIAATSYDGTPGVPAIFDRIFFPELRSLSGDAGARSLLAREAGCIASVAPPSPLGDVDTPQDYVRCLNSLPPAAHRRLEAHLSECQ